MKDFFIETIAGNKSFRVCLHDTPWIKVTIHDRKERSTIDFRLSESDWVSLKSVVDGTRIPATTSR